MSLLYLLYGQAAVHAISDMSAGNTGARAAMLVSCDMQQSVEQCEPVFAQLV